MTTKKLNVPISKINNDDITAFLRDKISSESTKFPWSHSDMIYCVEIPKTFSRGSLEATLAEKNNNLSIKHHYLAITKKKHLANDNTVTSHIISFFIQLNHNTLHLNCEKFWEVSQFRGADISTTRDDIILSTEGEDVTFTFDSTSSRDELLWVIIQCCKFLKPQISTTALSNFFVGYQIDQEMLSYSAISNGILNRHPLLKEFVNKSLTANGDNYSEEESAVEEVLKEINWTPNQFIENSSNLQTLLSSTANMVNVEIIDFLLQWEENDDKMKAVAKNSFPSASNSSISLMQVRDTKEILQSLTQVDTELGEVFNWLTIQIEKLKKVKSRLSSIELESGGLESNWKNLIDIRTCVYTVISFIKLNSQEESLLLNPDLVITKILKNLIISVSSSNDKSIIPLIQVGKKLQYIISFNGYDQSSIGNFDSTLFPKDINMNSITDKIWKQISSIPAIYDQRQKLLSICNSFVSKTCISLASLPIGILQNKTIQVDVKTFQIIKIIFHRKSEILRVASDSIKTTDSNMDNMNRIAFIIPLKLNVIFYSQHIYHKSLSYFSDLIEILIHIFKSNKSELREENIERLKSLSTFYIEATETKFYSILFKSLLHEFRTLVTPARSPLTLSTINRYKYKTFQDPIFKYSNPFKMTQAVTSELIQPWEMFQLFLLLILPIVVKEEEFFKKFFQILELMGISDNRYLERIDLWKHYLSEPTLSDTSYSNTQRLFPTKTQQEELLSSSFSGLLLLANKLAGYSSSDNITKATATTSGGTQIDGDVDIIETISMLSVLQQFAQQFILDSDAKTNSAIYSSETTSEVDQNIYSTAQSPLLCILLCEIKRMLLLRLLSFQNSQIKWIQSQKVDIKKSGVTAVFSKFVALVYQVYEMLNGEVIEAVNQLIILLTKEIFIWLINVAQQNEKYTNVFKLHHFAYFVTCLQPIASMFPGLNSFIETTKIHLAETESKYILWMITYELSSLASLATRMEGIGTRVREEELALYIRRMDVQTVTKELDVKKFESCIYTIRKRLEKHFETSEDAELKLVTKLWVKLKEKIVDIILKLQLTASNSYQINLEISPTQIANAFDRYM